MQLQELLANPFVVAVRWLLTGAVLCLYLSTVRFNLRVLREERKRKSDDPSAESMIVGNCILLACATCPFTSQFPPLVLLWLALYFLDPGSWFWFMLPIVLVRGFRGK